MFYQEILFIFLMNTSISQNNIRTQFLNLIVHSRQKNHIDLFVQILSSYHIIQRILSTAIIDNDREAMNKYLPHIFHTYPNRPDCGGRLFWAGIVYYNLGDFERSIIILMLIFISLIC